MTHATLYALRVTPLPVGRRASGFVPVAKEIPTASAMDSTVLSPLLRTGCRNRQKKCSFKEFEDVREARASSRPALFF